MNYLLIIYRSLPSSVSDGMKQDASVKRSNRHRAKHEIDNKQIAIGRRNVRKSNWWNIAEDDSFERPISRRKADEKAAPSTEHIFLIDLHAQTWCTELRRKLKSFWNWTVIEWDSKNFSQNFYEQEHKLL